MITTPRRLLACAALAVGATAAVTPAAFADTSSSSSTLSNIKSRAAAAITTRTTALQSAISAAQSNKFLTSSDRTTILATLNSDLSGLNALAPVIQADSTVAQARTDYQSIFTKYRVFALALPQARFAAAADDLTGTVTTRLTDAQTRLEKLLAGPDASKDSSTVQAAMTDLGSRISGIASDTNGLSATVLAFTPSDWNANHELLSPAKTKLQDARSDAKSARQDIKTVVQAIRS